MATSRFWREIPQRYRLEASKCKRCGREYFPPRAVCPECKSYEMEKVVLPSEGKVVTYTIIHVAPAAWRTLTPYAMGIIELTNGVRLTAQIVDCDPEKIEIGQEVRLEFRRLLEESPSGVIGYGYKAVPV